MDREPHVPSPPARPTDWLREAYQARRRKNPRYSLSAFARHLGVSSGRMSELMAGKRNITPKLALRIVDRLGYDPAWRDLFLGLVAKRRRGATVADETDVTYQALENDVFHVISDWYHYAVLSLVETRDCQPDVAWIAQRLQISPVEVRTALERLERLGLVARVEDRLYPTGGPLTTSQDVPSAAIRLFHMQHLQFASAALEDVSVEERDFSGMTMAIDPGQLPEAKRLIRDFRRNMAKLLEQGERSEVFHLSIQLYPLTKKVHRQ